MPSISIVLPTYNRLARLKKCLPTFLKTKVGDCEFVVVDNASDDGTWEYLKSISVLDSRVRPVRNPQNVGGIKTQFRGFCEVRSPFVLFLADDDEMDGDYISICLNIFTKHPDVALVHHLFDGWKAEITKYETEYTIFQHGRKAIRQIYMKAGTYPGIALRMDKFSLQDYNLDRGTIYQQVEFSLKIAGSYPIAIVHKAGLIDGQFGDSVIETKIAQNRPDDLGIGERLRYALNVGDLELVQYLVWDLGHFAARLYSEIEQISSAEARQFLKTISIKINPISPVFTMMLIKRRRLIAAMESILLTFRNPIFLLNYFFFALAFSKKCRRTHL